MEPRFRRGFPKRLCQDERLPTCGRALAVILVKLGLWPLATVKGHHVFIVLLDHAASQAGILSLCIEQNNLKQSYNM